MPPEPTGQFSIEVLADGTRAFRLRFRAHGRRHREVVHERPVCDCGCGGGWDGGSNPPVDASAAYNEAIGGGSWEVIMANNGPLTATVSAVAVCATGPGSQARRELSRSAIRATVARQVAALRTRTK